MLLLLWSANSAKSDFVELEWSTAIALKKPVLPILLDDTPMPASLAAIHGLRADEWPERLAPSLRVMSSEPSRLNSRLRKAEVFETLQSGSEDEHVLADQMRAKARKLSSPGFLAKELLRSFLFPGLIALIGAFATTAVVWDNPLTLDFRLVMYAALLLVPTALIFATAWLVRKRTSKLLLVLAGISWVGLMTFYQSRIVAGPIVSVDEPSVVVLLHKSTAEGSVAAQLSDAVNDLPARLTWLDSSVAVKPFVYNFDPNASYVARAIRNNPFIRAVVKVSYQGEDVIEMRAQLPALEHWRQLAVQRVNTISNNSDTSFQDTTSLIVDSNLGFLLSTYSESGAMDYRLLGASFSYGILSEPGEGLKFNREAGKRVLQSSVADFESGLEATITRAYADFMLVILGRDEMDCEHIELLDQELQGDEYEWLEYARATCMSDSDFAAALRDGQLPESLISLVNESFALQALAGHAEPLHGIDPESLETNVSIEAARLLYTQCGNPLIGPAFDLYQNDLYVDPDFTRAAQCLATYDQNELSNLDDGVRFSLAESLSAAFIMGVIESPYTLISSLDIPMDDFCELQRDHYRSLIEEYFWRNLDETGGFVERARASGCMEGETAPRFLHLYEFLTRTVLDELISSSEHFNSNNKIDEAGIELLQDALTVLMGNHDSLDYYQYLLGQFLSGFNENGWCGGLRGLEDDFEKFNWFEAESLISVACDDPWAALLQPLLRGADELRELPVASTPVLLQQLVLLGELITTAGDGQGDGPGDEEGDEDRPELDNLTEKLSAFEYSKSYLEKYFPEIEAFEMMTLGRLKHLPPQEQIDFLNERLRRGNSRMINAYLAEAYVQSGNASGAAGIFRSLINSSESSLRRDYYSARLATLDSDDTCASIGPHTLTAHEVWRGDALQGILTSSTPLAHPTLRLATLEFTEPLENYAVKEDFVRFVEQRYLAIEHSDQDFVANLREQMPGALLRTLLIDFVWTNPDSPELKKMEEAYSELGLRDGKETRSELFTRLGLDGCQRPEDPDLLAEDIAAIVNDGYVLHSALENSIADILRRFEDTGNELPPHDVLQQQVIERLVVREIQVQRADELNLQVPDSSVDWVIMSMAQQIGLSVEGLRQVLERDNVDFDEHRESIRDDLKTEELRRVEVQAQIVISPEEIAQCLDELNAPEYGFSHILIGIPQEATSAQVTEAARRMEHIYQRLEAGDDFLELREEYSDGVSEPVMWRQADLLPNVFSGVITELTPGEVSEPISTPSGIHIVKLNDIRSRTPTELPQVRLRHIMIEPDLFLNDSAAVQKLRDASHRIEAGEAFSELAAELSDDPHSAQQGGELDWLSNGTRFFGRDLSFSSIDPGLISEPFGSSVGWHIVEVLEHRVSDRIDDRLQQDCEDQIRPRKFNEELKTYLDRLRDEAVVEIKIAVDS